jgi:pimeloyl-ACP methyl ester carboxylesterase
MLTFLSGSPAWAGRRLAATALLAGLAWPLSAGAQAPKLQAFAAPGGKGQPVLVVSGQSGAANYAPMAKDIAARGFAVWLVDGNDVFKANNAGETAFRAAVAAVRASAGGASGKIGVVGFSLGGGATMTYAARMPDAVAATVAVYPYTAFIANPPTFVRQIKVPTLVLAAVKDDWKACCDIAMARKLGQDAKAAGVPLSVVEYGDANHGFVLAGPAFRKADTTNALSRIAEHLTAALGPAPKQ